MGYFTTTVDGIRQHHRRKINRSGEHGYDSHKPLPSD